MKTIINPKAKQEFILSTLIPYIKEKESNLFLCLILANFARKSKIPGDILLANDILHDLRVYLEEAQKDTLAFYFTRFNIPFHPAVRQEAIIYFLHDFYDLGEYKSENLRRNS